MADDQPREDDIRRMNQILVEVRKMLEPFRANTEGAVIAGALANVMREILDAYPVVTRDQLTEGMVAFLKRVDVEGELRRADMGFIVPKGIM